MEQSTLQLADLPGSATNEATNGAAAVNQGGGDDDDSDKGGDEDVPMTFPQRVSNESQVISRKHLHWCSLTDHSVLRWTPR